MSGKVIGGTIKTNLRKVKSGYDQEFTLQRGVSAAPIKQVSLKNTYTNPKPVVKTKLEKFEKKIFEQKTVKKITNKIENLSTKQKTKISVATAVGLGIDYMYKKSKKKP